MTRFYSQFIDFMFFPSGIMFYLNFFFLHFQNVLCLANISSAPAQSSNRIAVLHFVVLYLLFWSLLVVIFQFLLSGLKIKLKEELTIMKNVLRLMVIKVGQKGMLLNINHAKGEQLMRAAVKWAVHGGNQ